MAPGLKYGRGKPLTAQTKEVLYNLYKYFEDECISNPSCVRTPAQLVAESSGVSLTSVRKVLSESKRHSPDEKPTFKSPKLEPNRKPTIIVDDLDQEAIRRTIHNLQTTNEDALTMKTLHAQLKKDIHYKGSVTTLRKHVKLLGFEWIRTEDNRNVLMELNPPSLDHTPSKTINSGTCELTVS